MARFRRSKIVSEKANCDRLSMIIPRQVSERRPYSLHGSTWIPEHADPHKGEVEEEEDAAEDEEGQPCGSEVLADGGLRPVGSAPDTSRNGLTQERAKMTVNQNKKEKNQPNSASTACDPMYELAAVARIFFFGVGKALSRAARR